MSEDTIDTQKAEKKLFKLEIVLSQLKPRLSKEMQHKWGHYFVQLGQEWLDGAFSEELKEKFETAVRGLDVEKYS